ncbi:Protein RTE1-HOMOLOG [Diplonema papillatum]|nr:Protein RTE1-HOMOLOG [Diplonema papillatum]
MFPVIGHMGICDSQGRVHDFAGPYCVGIDHFMVGKVRRIYRVPIDWEPEKWDEAIERADREYKKTVHNLFCNNCHHHTAAALTHFGIPSTQWSCWFDVMFRGQWVSKGDMLCIVLPFLVFVAVVSLLAMHSKF